MNNAAPLLLALLCASTHGADADSSRLDGRWRAVYTTAPDAVYEMEFTRDRFHATQGEASYKGTITLDTEADPPRIDFTILECECGFLNKTSEGIFRWDGEVIELRAPQPGDPRPTKFDAKSGETMRLAREGD